MRPGLVASTRRGPHGRDSQGFAGFWEPNARCESAPHTPHRTQRRRSERRRGTGSAEAKDAPARNLSARDLEALHLPDESRARHPEYTSGVGFDVLRLLERLDDAGLLLASHFLEEIPGSFGGFGERDIARRHRVAVGRLDDQALHERAELAHVARPGVARQPLAGRARERYALPRLGGVRIEEVIH